MTGGTGAAHDVGMRTRHHRLLATVWIAVAVVVGLAAESWLVGVVAAVVVTAVVAAVLHRAPLQQRVQDSR